MRPVPVLWSDKHAERSVGLGGLHKLLAHDPALGLAVLRGLKEWEHGCQCAELWGSSRPYNPTSWAHLGEVGWLGCEDGVLWRGMGGGEGREVKEEREGASTPPPPPTPPPPSPSPPSAKKKQGQSPRPHPRPKAEAVRVGLGRGVRQPRLFLFVVLRRRHPPQEESRPPQTQRPSPPQKRRGGRRRRKGVGKKQGRRRRRKGGRDTPIPSWEPPPTSQTGAG